MFLVITHVHIDIVLSLVVVTAYFYFGVSGETASAGGGGAPSPDEHGSTDPLRSYIKADIVVDLPRGTNVYQTRWFAVWDETRSVSIRPLPIFPLLQGHPERRILNICMIPYP